MSSSPQLSPLLKSKRSASTDTRASTPFIVVRSSTRITSRGDEMNSSKINFLVKKMSTKDLFQKNESQTSTAALINIHEEKTEDFVMAEKPFHSSEFTLTKNENSNHQSKTNIFQADKIDQTKFLERNQQGPMFQNGKVLKRSIVGPVEIFERQQRLANRSKSTIRFSARLSEDTNRANLSVPYHENENTNGSMFYQQSRYSLLNSYHKPKPKKGIEPPPQLIISKDQVFREIQDITVRQQQDLSKSTQALPEKSPLRCLSARVYHTKQQRNLVKFDQMAQYWQKSIQNINDKIGRSGLSSVMMSLNKHREKKEQDNILEIIKTDEDGTHHWEKSLRKQGGSKLERAVSTGTLFVSRKERINTDESDIPPSSLEVIRKPKLMMIPLEKQTRPQSQAAIDKTQREYLNSRIGDRKDLINSVHPPELEQVRDLAIKGENKFNLERAQILKEVNNTNQVIVLKDLFEARQTKYEEETIVRNRNSIQIVHKGLGSFIK